MTKKMYGLGPQRGFRTASYSGLERYPNDDAATNLCARLAYAVSLKRTACQTHKLRAHAHIPRHLAKRGASVARDIYC
jgi:hypothetical protein